MGAVLGLLLGIGLVLIGSAFTVPRARRTRRERPAAELLARAGLPRTGVRRLVLASVGCGLLALVAVQALSRTWPVAVVFALLATGVPTSWLRGRARRRQRELVEVWPEVVDHLASGVRAGLGLAEAIAALAIRGPEPLRPAFTAFARDHQAGARMLDALDRLADRLADPVGDRVVEALRVAREVGGGDLGRLLRNLAGFLREDARTRAELEARQAWTVNGARLAVSAPWLVLLMLSFQPEVIHRYSSPAGVVVLAGGALACAGAYAAMLRVGRLPVERRVFR